LAKPRSREEIERAVKRGLLRRDLGINWVGESLAKQLISEQEANLLREVDALRARVVAVDDFEPDEVRPNCITPGHNIKSAISSWGDESAARGD
jgi:acyl-CoA dehydrogenase